jgi:hypothetical protein
VILFTFNLNGAKGVLVQIPVGAIMGIFLLPVPLNPIAFESKVRLHTLVITKPMYYTDKFIKINNGRTPNQEIGTSVSTKY